MLSATVLRSLARRKLAPTSPTIKLTSTQELASLCLAITAAESEGTGDLAKWIEERKRKSSGVDFKWEPVTGQLISRPRTPTEFLEERHKDDILQQQEAPPRPSSITREPRQFGTALPEIAKFIHAAKDSPNLVHSEVRRESSHLGGAIMLVAAVLRSGKHAGIPWRTEPIFQDPSGPPGDSVVLWEVPIIRRHNSTADSASNIERLKFQLVFSGAKSGLDPWIMLGFGPLYATLSFWLHTLRAREDSANIQLSRFRYTLHHFQRVVGRRLPGKKYTARTLEQWTGVAVSVVNERQRSPSDEDDGQSNSQSICFGMHLSYESKLG
jgi:hypothetical protein